MKNKVISVLLSFRKLSLITAMVLLVLTYTTAALAAPPPGEITTLTGLSSQVQRSVSTTSVILLNVALIAGIGFILASFFKFYQHKQNPTQVPMSQALSLLVIGAALTLFPTMIKISTSAVLGTSKTSQVSGTGITSLIGGGGS